MNEHVLFFGVILFCLMAKLGFQISVHLFFIRLRIARASKSKMLQLQFSIFPNIDN